MTDKKISELTSITGADVSDANDVLPIVDTSVATTKKITRAELFKGVSSVDINGGTIDGTVIGGSTPAAISGTDLTLSGGVVFGAIGGSVISKTLDDYEEGTWTPSLGGLSSVTYNYNLGSYRKVGSLVVAFWDSIVTASSGTFNAAINGLPFTVNPSMAGFSAIQHRSSDLFNAGAVGTGKLSGFAQRGAAYLTVQVEYQTNTSNGFGFANDPGFNGTGRSTGYIIYEST